MGGGLKQLTPLYINNNGTRNEILVAYANINGSSKEIFTKLYKWAKYTWSTDGKKLRELSGQGDVEDTTNYHSGFDLYRYMGLSDDGSYWILTELVNIDFKFSSTYFEINGNRHYFVSDEAGSARHNAEYGIQYSHVGNDYNFWFTTPLYCEYIGDDINPDDPHKYKTATYDIPSNCNEITHYMYDSIDENSSKIEYIWYSTNIYYLWKPNPVEYVTSTDRNAYTENNKSINVNSNIEHSSSTSLWYSPTYRFIG